MRVIKFLSSAFILLAVACNSNSAGSDAIKEFISGTYVKEVKNEFSLAYDTLIIQNTSGNDFLIVNRTAYQPIRNQKLLSARYSEVNWKAVYDAQSSHLNELKFGKTFSFDPINHRLFMGASSYTKINP